MNTKVIADGCSVVTVAACFTLKIPQILNILSLKSATGICLNSLLLELISYTVMFTYNYINGYSLLSYLEYPVILIQEYILIYLVLKYLKKIDKFVVFVAVTYFAIAIGLLLEYIPRIIVIIMIPLCTPISVSSKIMQFIAIYRAKNADSISVLTWFISTFTNMTRVFTIWLDSADLLLLSNFMLSVSLSSSIMLLAMYYKQKKIIKLA